jgi:hypothetical protein
VDSDALSSANYRDIRERPSQSTRSGEPAADPLTKGDLLIVAFVSSLWLWAAVCAITSAAL